MPQDRLSATLSALADPTRRAILARLADGEATVGELAAPFAMSLPAVSRHLKVLERAGPDRPGPQRSVAALPARAGAAARGRRAGSTATAGTGRRASTGSTTTSHDLQKGNPDGHDH